MGVISILLATGLSAFSSFALPIMEVNPESRHIRGTGILLSPQVMLTAAHVIDGKGTATSVRCGKVRIQGVVVKTADDFDLALVELETPCFWVPVSTLAPELPAVGDAVRAVGYPGGMGRMLTAGVVSAIDFYELSGVIRLVILSDLDIFAGNSGGPLLDAQQHVVGIVTGRACLKDDSQPVTCYASSAPVTTIRLFLERKE